jgi:D-amino-acid oxidase
VLPAWGTDRRAVVVGAGVAGLTTAHLLEQAGMEVVVLAAGFGRDTTSAVAGALWEWPPCVCGFYKHPPADALAREKAWAVTSYHRFQELAGRPETGVVLRPVTFYLDTPAADNPFELAKIAEMRPHVRDFVHDAGLIARNGVDPASGVVDAYRYLTPMIDTDMYLGWLTSRLLTRGVPMVQRTVRADDLAAVAAEFGADVVVNCCGVAGPALTGGDETVPVRGAWFLVPNDGRDFPVIREAHCTSIERAENGGAFVFVVPRGNNLILGGIAQPHETATVLDRSSPEIRGIVDRCRDTLPALRGVRIGEDTEFRVGLRPFRADGVRVEVEASTVPVVHHYGHGGSGVTLSWGSAEAAAALVRETVGTRAAGDLLELAQ